MIQSVGWKVETFASAEAFLKALDPARPGCLVVDVRMPGLSGFDLQDILGERRISLPVIFITGHGDVPMAVRAMRAGAADFIQKPINDQLLLDRIAEAIRKSTRTTAEEERRRDLRSRLDDLTQRENDVLALVVQGRQNKQIAYELGISIKTVEVHRHHVMEKMQAASAIDLARMLAELEPPGGQAGGKE